MLDLISFTINASLLAATIFILIYFYFIHAYRYWSSRGVPTVPPIIPFGNIGNPRNRKDPFYASMGKCYQQLKKEGHKHGGFYIGSSVFYLPIAPELIKNIMSRDFPSFINRGLYYNKEKDPLTHSLFFMDAEDWRMMRTKLTPTFTSGKMKMMLETLLECSEPLSGEIAKLCSGKEKLDIKELSGSFTTDVIGSCAFGVKCNSFKNPDAEFRKFGLKMLSFDRIKTITRIISFMFPNFSRKIGIRFVPKEVSEFFTGAVKDTIRFREEGGFSRNDFMQLLLELKQQGVLSEENIPAQAFLFFIAGFETSSTTMTYALYELAQNEEVQEKVRREIEDVLGADGAITYEKLNELKYMKQVIDETLRKYPPLPFVTRVCTENYKVPDTDLVIEKGMKIALPILGYHMDKGNFPEPDVFDPERFSDKNKDKITPFTYLPFGEGPRICIGLRFGLMQTKVGLVTILRKFRLRLNPITPKFVTWDPQSFMLKSNEKIYLDAEFIK